MNTFLNNRNIVIIIVILFTICVLVYCLINKKEGFSPSLEDLQKIQQDLQDKQIQH